MIDCVTIEGLNAPMSLGEIALDVVQKPEVIRNRIAEQKLRDLRAEYTAELAKKTSATSRLSRMETKKAGLLKNIDKQQGNEHAVASMSARLAALEQSIKAFVTDNQEQLELEQGMVQFVAEIDEQINRVVTVGEDNDGSAYEARVLSVLEQLAEDELFAVFGVDGPFDFRTSVRPRKVPAKTKGEFDILVGIAGEDGVFEVYAVVECKVSAQAVFDDIRKFERSLEHLSTGVVTTRAGEQMSFARARMVYCVSKDFERMLAPKTLYAMLCNSIAAQAEEDFESAIPGAIEMVQSVFGEENDTVEDRVAAMMEIVRDGRILYVEA